jgi:hypothetical protein
MANRQNQERFCPKGRRVVVPHEGRKLWVLSAGMLLKCRYFRYVTPRGVAR